MSKFLRAGKLGDVPSRFERPILLDPNCRIDDSVVVYPADGVTSCHFQLEVRVA